MRATSSRPLVDIEDISGLRDSLLRWYDTTHRLLPWRVNRHSRRVPPEPVSQDGTWTAATADRSAPGGLSAQDFAYGVLVSEVMLQQTQVARGQVYFVNWMRRWPTLAALALANEEEVNAVWAGLGYYRRAKFLLKGAQYAAASTGGTLPSTASALLKVPGVGPYTAAAVASIAYGEAVAAVDGNVVRVISRLVALRQEDPTKAAAIKEMQALVRCGMMMSLANAMAEVAGWHRQADGLLHPDRPGDWNQAMMELGARICTPKSPACRECPLSQRCAARAAELIDAAADGLEVRRLATDFPVRPAKAVKREESFEVCVVEWRVAQGDAWVLLVRRPDTGLLSGQWEFPSVPKLKSSSEGTTMDALLRDLGHGDSTSCRQPLGAVEHVFSHVRWTMSIQYAVLQRDAPPTSMQGVAGSRTWRWLKLDAEGTCAQELTGGLRKVIALIRPGKKAVKGAKRKDRHIDLI